MMCVLYPVVVVVVVVWMDGWMDGDEWPANCRLNGDVEGMDQ
jgi:hypothetical protein